jgi:hypothetical protein
MSWLRQMLKRWRELVDYEWRQVPNPNWRSSRGGRDYW